MKLKGPLVTLAVGGVLAGALLIADIGLSQERDKAAIQPVAVAVAPQASPSASASASASTTTAAAAAGQATYAGKVDGGGALSVVVKGSTAIAYLCDGTNEAWLWGTTDGTAVTLQNRNGATLTGTRGGGKVIGSLSVSGKTWSFTLPSVKKPSGLYRAAATVRGAKLVAGWVVLPDGRQVGAWTADGGAATPASPIDLTTGTATVDGAALTAAAVDPTTTTP